MFAAAMPGISWTVAVTIGAMEAKFVERLGFTREGFSRRYLKIDGRWRDHEWWALLKEDLPRPRRSRREEGPRAVHGLGSSRRSAR